MILLKIASFVIFVIKLIECEYMPNITLISQSLYNGHKFNLKCIVSGDTLKSAVTWIEPLSSISSSPKSVSEYIPSRSNKNNCDFDMIDRENCNDYWTKTWTINNSFYGQLGAVTDYRWEGFEEIYTDGSFDFKTVSYLNSGSFRIHFSIRIKQEAHIYICDRTYPPSANCYWILLGGWGGLTTAIRKCSAGNIPNRPRQYPKGSCSTKRDAINHNSTDKVLNENEWKHFTLEGNFGNFILWRLDVKQPILNYTDDDLGMVTPYLLVRSLETPGVWKFHNYDYLFSNNEIPVQLGPEMHIEQYNFCMSFFVAMCKYCSLTIQIQFEVESDIFQNGPKFVITAKQEWEWQEERINVALAKAQTRVRLFIIPQSSGIEGHFWAIDKFEMCSKNGYISEVRILTKEQPYDTQISCQAIEYPRWNLIQKNPTVNNFQETNCPSNTIGRNCIYCNKIFGAECEKSSICELKFDGSTNCMCTPGYTGEMCTKKCDNGYYGINCQEKCGFCANIPCNHITGLCVGTMCANDFVDERCTIPPLPVLLNPPEILEEKHTSLVVQFKDTSYKGVGEPLYYKLQYKRKVDFEWVDFNTYHLTYVEPIEINYLNILTEYEIRALLITKNNEIYNNVYVIPKNQATTTCLFIDQNEITIVPSNTTASITFKNTFESCRSEDYRIMQNNKIVSKSESFNFNIFDLTPFTFYRFLITNTRCNGSLQIEFNTTEGAPSVVREVFAKSFETSISLNWLVPATPNGVIKHYKIECEHINYLACGQNIIRDPQLKKFLEVYDTSVTITDLQPYSEYMIKITGYTNMYGSTLDRRLITLQSETPEQNEIPKISKIEGNAKSVRIVLDQPECKFIKGPFFFHVTAHCFDAWCHDIQPLIAEIAKINYQDQSISLDNLLPFSHYEAMLKVGRVNGRLFSGDGMKVTFATREFEPNVLKNIVPYSKTESSIYLRFPSPYPPTGIISQYQIRYCYTYGFWKTVSCNTKIFQPTKCKLWKDLNCVFIFDLQKDTLYTINIQAKNVGTDFGRTSPDVQARTIQEKPGPPENLTASWNDHYNLTLNWTHPSIINGPLTKFIIRISTNQVICYTKNVPIRNEDYSNTYTHMITLTETCLSSHLFIYVSGFNVKEGSSVELKEVTSPPVTPLFQTNPFLESTTNTTLTISFTKPQKIKNSIIRVIISTQNNDIENDDEQNEEIGKKFGLPTDMSSWVAGEFDLNTKQLPQTFTIGNGNIVRSNDSRTVIRNEPLRMNTSYIITVVIINTFEHFQRYKAYKILASTGGSEATDGGYFGLFALFGLLLVVPIIAYYVMVRRKEGKVSTFWASVFGRRNDSTGNSGNPDVIPLTTNSEVRPKLSCTQMEPEVSNVANSKAEIPSKYSKPVKIIDFENYVKEAIASGELDEQHQLFPRGQTKPWNYGLLPQNKPKNRYNNLIAYDHTRVKLEKIDGDTFSDYINANYIEGYKSRKAYIATQGPKPATVNDFWRMIWQENVKYIVMLANVIEANKKKSEQYWPNVNEILEFGNIKVEYVSSQIFADYEYRTFSVQNENVERKIEQLHFTSWPDHGVPLYSQSLVPFLRKLLTIPQGNSPIVVHCSAGVGRTGTIILCDLCLRMAAREGVVDILKYQYHLREQRVNLVDNVEQYKLAHLVLLDCLIAPNTTIPCDESMETEILKLLKSDKIKDQMRYLEDTDWQDEAMRPQIQVSHQSEWEGKNRFQDIVPSGYGRVYLSRYPPTDEHSDYINAVEVDGFRSPQLFIATQQPLSNTVGDFWRMINEKEVKVIVSLNEIDPTNTTTSIFWPTKEVNKFQPVNFITLEFHDESDYEYYTLITINLYNNKNKKQEKRTLYLLTLKDWPHDKLLPNSAEGLLKLWEEAERFSRNSSPIVVTCFNGANACGLFLSFTFVIEKMKLEQQCDVCLAVRTIRHNRKQFVTNIEQFAFLYRLALSYMSSFELYSNFCSNTQKKSEDSWI